MGRADQTTRIKGMFVRPKQMAEVARRHAELKRLRLVVTRVGEIDAMTLPRERYVLCAMSAIPPPTGTVGHRRARIVAQVR